MRTMIITIGRELTLTGTLSTAPVGAAASFTLTARGGLQPYTIRVLSSDFPVEWTITPNTDGTVDIATASALTPGEFTVVFELSDGDRYEVTVTRTLRVVALPLELLGDYPDAVEDAPYAHTVAATGGQAPITYAVLTGAIPTGTTLNTATGEISGTPTTPATYSFTIRATDSLGAQADGTPQSVTITVDTNAVRRELRASVASLWMFDNTQADTGRAGNTLAGSPTYHTGPLGEANGAASYASDTFISSVRGINVAGQNQEWTWCGFIYVDTTQSRNWFRVSNAAGSNHVLRISNSGSALNLLNVATGTIASGNVLVTGWHWFVIRAVAGTVTVYEDGASIATGSVASGAGASTYDRIVFEANVIRRGVMFAHAALSDSAISYYYNGGALRPASDWNTVAYGTTHDAYLATLIASGVATNAIWKCDATSGTTIVDSLTGGIGNIAGTNGAAQTTVVDPPSGFSAAEGVFTTDGANDYGDIPDVNLTSGSRAYAFGGFFNPDTAAVGDVLMRFGTSASTEANSRGITINQVSGSTAGVNSYQHNGTPTLTGNAGDQGFVSLSTGAWSHVVSLFDDTAGTNGILMMMAHGYVVRTSAMGAAATGVNLTANYIGGRTTTNTADGNFSRWFAAFKSTLKPPQVTKLCDLGNGSG